MVTWQELYRKIDKKIEVGTAVPKAVDGTRVVTKKEGDRIYMRTGVETTAEKYITKEMLQYAYKIIKSGKPFTSKDLKTRFPKEYSQGSCVFSMTGGIFVLLGIAKYIRRTGYILAEGK